MMRTATTLLLLPTTNHFLRSNRLQQINNHAKTKKEMRGKIKKEKKMRRESSNNDADEMFGKSIATEVKVFSKLEVFDQARN